MGWTATDSMRLILAAARRGALRRDSARRWATLAARGEDISIVSEMVPGAEGMRPAEVTELATELAGIFAGAGTPPLSRDELSDIEADVLFPPKTMTEAAERARTVQAAAQQLRELPDDELYSALFVAAQGQPGAPPGTFEPGQAPPGHEQYTGQHVHEHSDYQGGRHSHPHMHNGDANHDHQHLG